VNINKITSLQFLDCLLEIVALGLFVFVFLAIVGLLLFVPLRSVLIALLKLSDLLIELLDGPLEILLVALKGGYGLLACLDFFVFPLQLQLDRLVPVLLFFIPLLLFLLLFLLLLFLLSPQPLFLLPLESLLFFFFTLLCVNKVTN